MKRIDPINFRGPRAYFTDFDYNIVRFKYNKEAYKKEVERRLKIILLTKNKVICAASHMTHKFAYNLFEENPILLTENMILPALRKDKEHVIDYLQDKRVKVSLKEVMKDFYQEHVNEVVNWELMENVAWFRDNLLKALRNEHSVIRRNLTGLPKWKLDSLIDEIEKSTILTRELILKGISTWSSKEKKILLNFVNLVYHMSGARVINCESTLPQENYIDYSLTDFSQHRAMLSDTQVFSKIFFELAFETLYRDALSVELLNMLSFEDVYYMRKPLENSSFYERYDNLIQSIVQIVNNQEIALDEVVYDIEEPLKFFEQISTTFEEIFRQELPEFLKKKRKETAKGLQKSTISLGLGVAGFVPFASVITTPLGLILNSRDFIINLNQYFKSGNDIKNYDSYLEYKAKMLRQMIEKYRISKKSPFLDALDLITSTITARIVL